jgi:hypothetical protein
LDPSVEATGPSGSPLSSQAATGDPLAGAGLALSTQASGAESSVSSLTTVTNVAPEAAAGDAALAAGRLRDAFASVAHQSVLRGAASGQIDIPELGRVVVHARSTDAGVDLAVTAERGATHSVLREHAGAMALDLQQADLRVGRLAIEPAHGSSSSRFEAGTGGGGFDASSNQRGSAGREGTSDETSLEGAEPEPTTAAVGRVRIVL